MMKINKKKYIISLFVTVLGLFGLISGTSYAILSGNSVSTNEQVIKAGSVELQLTENYNNIDTGAYIVKDEDGLLQETVYEFYIKNIGSVPAKYDLNLLNEAPSGYTAISDSYIRIGLEVNGKEMGPMGLSNVNNVIDSNTIYENEIIRYKMRVWFDKTHATQIQSSSNKAYLSLSVDAKQAEYESGVIYRSEEDRVTKGTLIDGATYTGYCIVYDDGEDQWNSCTDNHEGFENIGDCNDEKALYDDPSVVSCEPGSWTVPGISYTKDASTLNRTYYIKHTINSKKAVQNSYVCYTYNNNEYCLKGGDAEYNSSTDEYSTSPSYDDNKKILNNTIGTSNCMDKNDYMYSVPYYYCELNNVKYYAVSDGNVIISKFFNNTTDECFVYNDSESSCWSWS